jgi:hypothetical protein
MEPLSVQPDRFLVADQNEISPEGRGCAQIPDIG